MPEIIQFKYGNQIINKYDAGGQKLETRYVTFLTPLSVPLVANDILQNIDVTEAEDVTITGTSYVGNFEYGLSRTFDYDVTNAPVDNRWLSKVYNAEGYTTAVTYQTWGPIYNYYRKDHLGNNREVWQAAYNRLSRNFPATTTQATQYYPSGLPWAESTGQSTQNKKYNGKEFVEAHGLDEYDSEARWFYPAIMRTTTLDPLAEKYYSISPYAWCGNNPVNAVDPDGKSIRYDDNKKSLCEWGNAYFYLYAMSEYYKNNNSSGNYDNQIQVATSMMGYLRDIADSKTIFSFENISGKEGFTGYNPENNSIVIQFINLQNLLHELTHAKQILKNEIGYVYINGHYDKFAYDVYDELEAYSNQIILSGINIKNIDIKWLKSLGLKSYNNILDIPLNSNTQFWLYRLHTNKSKKILIGEDPRDFIRLSELSNVLFLKK